MLINDNLEKNISSVINGANVKTMGDIYDLLNDNQAYSVKIHIGRMEIKSYLGFDLIDTSGLTNEQKEKLVSNLKGITASAIPVETSKKLKAIENTVRQKLQQLSIGNTSFITKSALDEFLDYFEEKKTEYFAIEDELSSHFEEIVNEYISKITELADSVMPEKKDLILAKVRKSLPKKQSFEDSFYMDLEFSNNLDIAVFTVERQKTIEEAMSSNLERNLKEISGGILKKLWNSIALFLEKLVVAGDCSALNEKSRNALKNAARKATNDNIIGNPFISDITTKVASLAESKDSLDITILSEEILKAIYLYCCDNNIKDYIDLSRSMYSEEELIAA